MCSIGEDDFGDDGGVHAMLPCAQPTVTTTTKGNCSKCALQDIEIFQLPFREQECCACFLHHVTHKFRAALGSSKILPRNAKVLLAFDGSAAAMTLLDMLHQAQQQNNYKRLHCQVQVLFLDDLMLTNKDYEQQLKQLQQWLLQYAQFPSWVLSLAALPTAPQLYKFTTDLPAYLSRNQQQEKQKLQRMFDMRSCTSRQDFVQQQRKALLAAAASQLQCEFVFLSDTSNKLAADLLAAVALGRGGSAASDMALLDARYSHTLRVQLVRPLRDLNELEISLYMRARKMQPALLQQSVVATTANSLQSLSHQFVLGLQQNFASTVSTVFRTGNKIAPNNDISISTCSFCHSTLDYANSSTLLAMEFSRLASETGSTLAHNTNLNELAQQNLSKLADDTLCHACRNLQNDGAELPSS